MSTLSLNDLSAYQPCGAGRFSGEIHDDLIAALNDSRLAGLQEEIRTAQKGVLARGRHQVVVLPFEINGEIKLSAVKAFGPQKNWKDRYDFKRGSKAARSFQAAKFLRRHGVSTPEPLAFVERWEDQRLVESYYLSEFVEDLTSFRDLLRTIFNDGRPISELVSLLEKVATSMRKMHDAGFYHRDLGNQNMELTPGHNGMPGEVYFVDLNRHRIRDQLPMKERALDFARLDVPSGFLEILVRAYWRDIPSDEFLYEMKKARRNFRWWKASRLFRHPIQSWTNSRTPDSNRPLPHRDIWIWNNLTAQAAVTLDKTDRKRLRSKRNNLKIASTVLQSGWGAWAEYKRQLKSAFQNRVDLSGRIGIAVDTSDLDFERQMGHLKRLGTPPVLLRFAHHEGLEQWEKTANNLDSLHQSGHEVMVAILQDRRAVLEPEAWKKFLQFVLDRIDGKVSMVELCHTVNRMKWGVHTLNDHVKLLEPVVELKKQHPGIKFCGPACIDFEYHYVVAALSKTPKGLNYDALSHHLYVDRRGAPENLQGGYGTVEKAALLKAIAVQSDRCNQRVIVSEVNWPLKETGIWSPVSRPYPMAGHLGDKVNVSELQYGTYMLRYLVLTLCSGFVDQVYWWRLVAHGFGLIDERANGGWRERIGFQMLEFFLAQLGRATFVKKLEVAPNVYALQFERESDTVTMMWCHGGIFSGPWPVEYSTAFDSIGQPIEPSEVGESPIYLTSK